MLDDTKRETVPIQYFAYLFFSMSKLDLPLLIAKRLPLANLVQYIHLKKKKFFLRNFILKIFFSIKYKFQTNPK